MISRKIIPIYPTIDYMVTLYSLSKEEIGFIDIEPKLNEKLDNHDFYVFSNIDAAMEFAQVMLQENIEYTYAMIDMCIWDDDHENCLEAKVISEVFVEDEVLDELREKFIGSTKAN